MKKACNNLEDRTEDQETTRSNVLKFVIKKTLRPTRSSENQDSPKRPEEVKAIPCGLRPGSCTHKMIAKALFHYVRTNIEIALGSISPVLSSVKKCSLLFNLWVDKIGSNQRH